MEVTCPPLEVAAEVEDRRPEKIGVAVAVERLLAAGEIKVIEQVHAAVGSPLVIDVGEVEIAVRPGVEPHRPRHVEVLREIGVVVADDQAVGHELSFLPQISKLKRSPPASPGEQAATACGSSSPPAVQAMSSTCHSRLA